MSATLQDFFVTVGVSATGAISLFGVGIFVRNLPIDVRVLIFVFAGVLSLPGLFGLFLLGMFLLLRHT